MNKLYLETSEIFLKPWFN